MCTLPHIGLVQMCCWEKPCNGQHLFCQRLSHAPATHVMSIALPRPVHTCYSASTVFRKGCTDSKGTCVKFTRWPLGPVVGDPVVADNPPGLKRSGLWTWQRGCAQSLVEQQKPHHHHRLTRKCPTSSNHTLSFSKHAAAYICCEARSLHHGV